MFSKFLDPEKNIAALNEICGGKEKNVELVTYGKTNKNSVLTACLNDLLQSKELSPINEEELRETMQDPEIASKKKINIPCKDTNGKQLKVIILQLLVLPQKEGKNNTLRLCV